MFKKIDKEIFFGGVFGILAVVATVCEMIVNGISASTIFSAIKDIAGTIVTIMVFAFAVKHLFIKKAIDFDGVFQSEMEKVITKYSPIIKEDEKVSKRYNIASNLDSIIGKESGAYHTMFELTSKHDITFNITKTVFKGRSTESFDEQQRSISLAVGSKITNSFEIAKTLSLHLKV